MSAVMAPCAPTWDRVADDGRGASYHAAGGDRLRLVSVVPDEGARDEGAVRSRRPSIQVRRRRAAVGAFVLAVVVLLSLPPGVFGAHHAAVSPGPRITASTYTVVPGDSMWSIAERADPGGDPRVLVAQLEARTGSSTVYPGEVLSLR
ncbi:MAG: LysM domain-containing protein [Actinomycetota bacterium]|nr:LysM domain-containing protein [Actinomycetota bacterium]